MKEIWIEKYRPTKLKEVVGQEEIVERLQAYVESGNLPHLLFAGPAGTGKTTCALALARELFGDAWRQNFLELNASDERGIDVVRGKIKEFARTAPIGDASFKIIFLDEADALTPEAQAALRRTMERYSRICRFILSCNYSSKIIDPIQSRCAVFRFRPLPADAIVKCLSKIAESEGLKITEDALEALVHVAQGDLRKAINSLQVAASLGGTIDVDTVYKITSTAHPEEVKKLLETALDGNFIGARNILHEIMITYGLAGVDLIKQIHRIIFDLPLSDEEKVTLVDKTGEIEFRIVEGGNERIQLEVLLAYLVFLGSSRNH